MQTDVLIAGAGLAGLSLAASLHKLGVDYRLADFGLRPEELRERFRFYTDYFGLERESAAQ